MIATSYIEVEMLSVWLVVMDPSLKRTTKTDELEPCACADASAAHSRASSSVSVVRTCTCGVNVVQASVMCECGASISSV